MPDFSLSSLSFQLVEVYSLKVDCTVTSRFAHTAMTSEALNEANTSQEITFEVELPKTAFISNFSMSVILLGLVIWEIWKMPDGLVHLVDNNHNVKKCIYAIYSGCCVSLQPIYLKVL